MQGSEQKHILSLELWGKGMSHDPQPCAGVGCQAARGNPLVLLHITPCSSPAEPCELQDCRTPGLIAEEDVVT